MPATTDKPTKPKRFEALKKANQQGQPRIVVEQPVEAAAPPPATTPSPKPLTATKAATRVQTKQVSGHYLKVDYMTLKTIGVEQDKTIQDMLGEALEMYVRSHGKQWVGNITQSQATA